MGTGVGRACFGEWGRGPLPGEGWQLALALLRSRLWLHPSPIPFLPLHFCALSPQLDLIQTCASSGYAGSKLDGLRPRADATLRSFAHASALTSLLSFHVLWLLASWSCACHTSLHCPLFGTLAPEFLEASCSSTSCELGT